MIQVGDVFFQEINQIMREGSPGTRQMINLNNIEVKKRDMLFNSKFTADK